MTEPEILEEFPLVTQEDLDELKSGDTVYQQATARSGEVYVITFDSCELEWSVTPA